MSNGPLARSRELALAPALAPALALATLSLSPGMATTASAASIAHPTVIELFQSQGCSSCPPANALLNGLADRPDVLALSFAVTYWDQLGWRDIFGSPRFTARQQDYAAAGRGAVATPEFIVNGVDAVLGSDRGRLAMAIAHADAAHAGPWRLPAITADGRTVRVGRADGGAAATVWLVRYDHGTRDVPIRAGENAGRTLLHRDIVRDLVKLGTWSGQAADFALPPPREAGLTSAVLIQQGQGGPIIAAGRL